MSACHVLPLCVCALPLLLLYIPLRRFSPSVQRSASRTALLPLTGHSIAKSLSLSPHLGSCTVRAVLRAPPARTRARAAVAARSVLLPPPGAAGTCVCALALHPRTSPLTVSPPDQVTQVPRPLFVHSTLTLSLSLLSCTWNHTANLAPLGQGVAVRPGRVYQASLFCGQPHLAGRCGSHCGAPLVHEQAGVPPHPSSFARASHHGAVSKRSALANPIDYVTFQNLGKQEAPSCGPAHIRCWPQYAASINSYYMAG